ncbi:hypothetical protein ABDK00_010785 [Niabella insulamsoli]|uniref:hypothetical protein n=1 Tax=Niabella insulamsoli TaxID=3144874 RepID=UPI0031FE037C
MKPYLLLLLGMLLMSPVFSQTAKSPENVIVITIDGCRWNEVFGGADSAILFNEKFKKTEFKRLSGRFWHLDPRERRKKLMPFMWSTIEKEGRIYGNKNFGSDVYVRNKTSISNPGYAEIFTGYADPAIVSNELSYNKNINLFAFLNKQPGFKNKVASFASWDRALGYLNAEENDFLINGGYLDVKGDALSPLQKTLNNLQQLYHAKESSRPDYITYLHAKEYVRLHQPRALSIGFAWTDDMAHDGSYPKYLEKILEFDNMIQDLWQYVQSLPQYKNNTVMFITVDHGRGYEEQWVSHGAQTPHANEIWFAIIGAGITRKGEIKKAGVYYQDQFAQTLAHLLGFTFTANHPVATRILDVESE